jgi:hypothetical protein
MTVTSYQTIDSKKYKQNEGRKLRKNEKRGGITSKNRSSSQPTDKRPQETKLNR